jgi:hypothetical protein
MVMSVEFPEERRWTVMGLGSQAGRSGFRNPDALGADQREGGTVVQTGGVVQGANTIPRRGRLNALLAVAAAVAIAAAVALLIWVVPPVTSGVGVEDAAPAARAGSAIVHDDAGSVHSGLATGYAAVHDDAGNMPKVAGSAIVHDDAGSVHSGAGSAAGAKGEYPETYYPLPNGKLASLNAGSGSAVIHDDAGSVNR